jgi:hypothetical protein
MKVTSITPAGRSISRADRTILINSITLIALGLSILFLNSWDNLFVRASVGVFWGAFLVILNGPDAVRTFRSLTKKNDDGRASYRLSPE